jgi:hypothetical protein
LPSVALLLAILTIALVAYNNLDNMVLSTCTVILVFATLIFIGCVIALLARDYTDHIVYILTLDSKN